MELVCTCTVITAARLVEPEQIRNMVAPPKPATASTRPPIGYDTMDGEQQVRAWLDLFGEKISNADYADGMIENGWDSLANMIFTATDLMDAMPDTMKMGHANRIARDAEVMLALSYLAATNDFKISGIMSPKIDSLEYYSDSDHAGDMPITTCSHTGTVIMLNKVPIHWRSKKKQPKTSRSSAEAEVYALSDTPADSRLNN